MGLLKPSSKEANISRFEENQRQEKIRNGTTHIDTLFKDNFSEPFYQGRRQGYIDYATPQLETQFADAQKQLTFDLDRSGQLDSSVRAAKQGELQKLYNTQKQKIGDDALSYETQARNSVEGARSELIGNLNATGDAEGAVNAALARSQALTAPAAYNPLTSLFATFTGTLGNQAAQERAQMLSGGQYKAKYDTGLFSGGSSGGAVKTYGS